MTDPPMLSNLLTATNPGQYVPVDTGISDAWFLVIPAVFLIAATIYAVVEHRKYKFHDLWTAAAAGFVAAVVTFFALFITLSFVDDNAQAAPRAEWNAEVAAWAADEYGIDITADEVDTMTHGIGRHIKTVVNDEIVWLDVTDISGDKIALIDGDDNLIQPLAGK